MHEPKWSFLLQWLITIFLTSTTHTSPSLLPLENLNKIQTKITTKEQTRIVLWWNRKRIQEVTINVPVLQDRQFLNMAHQTMDFVPFPASHVQHNEDSTLKSSKDHLQTVWRILPYGKSVGTTFCKWRIKLNFWLVTEQAECEGLSKR